jgi:26S proteasome regulatory subunit N2
MPALTSAAGLVGFLSEPDPTLQAFALERLNEEIDSVWTEVSGSIGQMYVLNAILDLQKSRYASWSCALAA